MKQGQMKKIGIAVASFLVLVVGGVTGVHIVQEQPEEVQTADAVTTNRDTSQTEAPAIAEETDTATTITAAVTLQTEQPEQTTVETEGSGSAVYYTFRNDSLLDSHY